MGVDPSIFPVIAAHRNISTNTCDKHRPKCYATIKIIINGLPSFHDCVKPSVKEQIADMTRFKTTILLQTHRPLHQEYWSPNEKLSADQRWTSSKLTRWPKMRFIFELRCLRQLPWRIPCHEYTTETKIPTGIIKITSSNILVRYLTNTTEHFLRKPYSGQGPHSDFSYAMAKRRKIFSSYLVTFRNYSLRTFQ